MTMKATAQAPSNIAFVKYWGKSNDGLTLPNNSSISMNLADLFTTTTVEFNQKFDHDQVEIGFFGEKIQEVTGQKKQRVVDQLDRLRKIASLNLPAQVRSINNFPADVGVASSASAFAALTTAACAALNIKITAKKLSILTRLGGSGSATRSIPNGFTEWKKGTSNNTSFAEQIAPASHWPLFDVILIVSSQNKKTSSLEGHDSAKTSPYYKARLAELKLRVPKVRQAIIERNFSDLGKEIEKDALSLHFMAMTSVPPIWYWQPETLAIIKEVYELREKGIEAYFTIDAGPNVHIICEQKNAKKVKNYFSSKNYIQSIFMSKVGNSAHTINEHLF